MKRCLLGICLVLSLALTFARPALAQNYSFTLIQETVNVYWQSDGTLSLDYVFLFANDAGASPIDFVDVGLPNNSYDVRKMRADVDGHPLSDIQMSPYVSIGVAVGLGAYAITPGHTGTVHVAVDGLTNVLFPDSSDSSYTSAEFSPTWFDPSAVHGVTDLTIVYHLPPGVKPEEPRYHKASSPLPAEPAAALDDQGRVTYTWYAPHASGGLRYTVGASFPDGVVPASAISRVPTGAPPTAVVYQSSSQSSSGGDFGSAMWGTFCAILSLVATLSGWVFKSQGRKQTYDAPKVEMEGHGIKRGLTAVEAAVLMKEPLDKVLAMMLFSVIKKGAATVAAQNPLRLSLRAAPPGDLRVYELDFLDAFTTGNGQADQDRLRIKMVKLIASVEEKMRGFSRQETVDYYKTIIEQAWAQVQAANTPEVKGKKFDEVMDWTLLDKDFAGHSRQVLGPEPMLVPDWGLFLRPSPPSHTAPSGGGGVMAAPVNVSSGGPPSLPSMGGGQPAATLPHLPGSDFAASIANSVQNFSSSFARDMPGFASSVAVMAAPPSPPKSSSSGDRGGGGGGSSCVCACACAGCACACAGGGR